MKTFAKLFASLGIFAFASVASAQQIHIKARFVEVPKETLEALQKDFGVASDGTELLTPEQMSTTLQEFESDSSVKELAAPEVTTTSGRQTQMRTTTIQTILTNFVAQETSTSTNIVAQTEEMECGPMLDIISTVSSDGLKIGLTTTASVTKFLGYDKPPAIHPKDGELSLPVVLPKFEVKKASAQTSVPDGQTLILFGKSNNVENQLNSRSSGEQELLVVMITPTIVDAAGNRIHLDN